jgi:hypothetical protein
MGRLRIFNLIRTGAKSKIIIATLSICFLGGLGYRADILAWASNFKTKGPQHINNNLKNEANNTTSSIQSYKPKGGIIESQQEFRGIKINITDGRDYTPAPSNVLNLREGLNILSEQLAAGSGSGWSYDNGLILSNSIYYTPVLQADFLDNYPLWAELFVDQESYQNLVQNPGFQQGEGNEIPGWNISNPQGYTYRIAEENTNRYLEIEVSDVNGYRQVINQSLQLSSGYYALIFRDSYDGVFATTAQLLASLVINVNGNEHYLRANAGGCGHSSPIQQSTVDKWQNSRILILHIPAEQQYTVDLKIMVGSLMDGVQTQGVARIDDIKLLKLDPIIKSYGIGSVTCCDIQEFNNYSREVFIAKLDDGLFISFVDDDLSLIDSNEAAGPTYARVSSREFLEIPLPQGYKYGVIALDTTTDTGSTVKIKDIRLAVYRGWEFLVPWDVRETPATDLRGIFHSQDDRIIADGEVLRFAATQQPVKFWGTAYEFTLNYCWDETIMRSIAKRLKTHGFNLVKLVGLTTIIMDETTWDCYDKFIEILEDEGFYIYLSIVPVQIFQLVLGPHPELDQTVRDLFGDFPEFDFFYQGDSWPYNGPGFKNVMYTNHPEIISFLHNLIQYELNHTNPYTGLKYKDDPRIAFLELSNENYLIRKWKGGYLSWNNPQIPDYYQELFDERWHNWLSEKYNDDFEMLAEAWDDGTGIGLEEGEISFDTVKREPDFSDENPWNNPYSNPRTSDLAMFYATQQENLYNNLSSFAKDIGSQQLIIGTQTESPYGARAVQLSETIDIVDTHRYYDHPIGWYNDLRDVIKNRHPFDIDFADLYTLFGSRVNANIKGKPQTISEFNWAQTNSYYFMLFPMFMAYSSLQGFSAPMMHSYQHCCVAQGQEYPPTSDRIGETVFRFTNNPVALIQNTIAGLAFARGDFNQADTVDVNISRDFIENNGKILTRWSSPGTLDKAFIENHYPMIHRLLLDYDSEQTTDNTLYNFTDNFQSDTNQITFDYSSELFKAVSDKTVAIAGKLYHNQLQAGPLQLQAQTPMYGSIMMTSLDGQPITESTHLLLTAVSRARNYAMQTEASGRFYESWGEAPVIANTVTGEASIVLDNAATDATVYKLNPAGERSGILSSQLIANNNNSSSNTNKHLSFILGDSLWYEIVIRH